jgi:hypothetical protein
VLDEIETAATGVDLVVHSPLTVAGALPRHRLLVRDEPGWEPLAGLEDFLADGTPPVALTLGSIWPVHRQEATLEYALAAGSSWSAARRGRCPTTSSGWPVRTTPGCSPGPPP